MLASMSECDRLVVVLASMSECDMLVVVLVVVSECDMSVSRSLVCSITAFLLVLWSDKMWASSFPGQGSSLASS